MATLWINPPTVEGTLGCRASFAPELRDWLAGDWCLLFSHPQDFDAHGLECDRWLGILRDDFLKCRVRPLAYGHWGERDRTWLSQLFGDDGVVLLSRPSPPAGWRPKASGEIVDLAPHVLRDDILAQQGRFVLILDTNLRRRGLLTYLPGRNHVSPFDLLASVQALRRSVDLCRAA